MEAKDSKDMQIKEILDYLDIEAADLAAFKAAHSGKYMTERQIHSEKKLLDKFTGKTLGRIKGDILNGYRELEVPFTQNEFDDVELVDVVKTLNQRRNEKFAEMEAELKGQIGKTGEEAVKPYQEKLTKYEQSLADEKKAKKEIADQFDAYKSESAGKVKEIGLKYYKNQVMSSLDYDPIQIKDELKREGWESHVEKNFKFDHDETGKEIILDKAGNKIKNPKKADEWLGAKEVLAMEADKFGILKKNQQGGQRAFGSLGNGGGQKQIEDDQTKQTNPHKISRLAPGMEQYLSK